MAPELLRPTITELLANKEAFRGKRVEVFGYYCYFFEHSVLTSKENGATSDGIWVNTFHIAPGCKGTFRWVEKGPVRIIGTFEFTDYGSGHMGMCPAEITELELFEARP